jgi:hypothetical protein
MGYKYRLVNGRKIICEQKHVVASKIVFLRKFLQYKNSSENIIFVYLDETWVYQNGSNIRRWVHEKDIKSNPSKIKSEGKRFTWFIISLADSGSESESDFYNSD